MNAAYSSVLVQNLKVALLDQRRGAAPAEHARLRGAHASLLRRARSDVQRRVALYAGAISAQAASISDSAARTSRSTSQTRSNWCPIFRYRRSKLRFPTRYGRSSRSGRSRGRSIRVSKAVPASTKYWAGLGSKSKLARRLEVGGPGLRSHLRRRHRRGASLGRRRPQLFRSIHYRFFSPIVRAQVRLESPRSWRSFRRRRSPWCGLRRAA